MLAYVTPETAHAATASHWWLLALLVGIVVLAALPVAVWLARLAAGGMLAGAAASAQLAAGVLLLVAYAQRPADVAANYVLRGYGASVYAGLANADHRARAWLAAGLALLGVSALGWVAERARREHVRTVNGPSSAEVSA